MTIKEVREAGRQAYRDNLKITDNPFPKETDGMCNWFQWVWGWKSQRDAVRW